MDITIGQQDLVEALKAIAPAVSKYSTLPILKNVEICADSSGVRFATCDLESYAEYFVKDALVTYTGRTTVSHKELLDLAKQRKKETIRLSSGDGYNECSLVVTGSAGSTAKLEADDTTDFPRGAHNSLDKKLGEVVIDRERFMRMVEFVAPCAATDDSRPVMTAVNCELVDGILHMATGDAFRMALAREVTLPKKSWRKNPLVPAKPLAAFAQILPGKKDPEAEVGFIFTECRATIICGPMTVDIRLVDGRWPDWRYIVSTVDEWETMVTGQAWNFLEQLDRLKDIAKETSWITYWSLGKEVKAKAQDEEKQIEAKVLSATRTGKDLDIVFNHQHLKNALNRFPTAQVKITMTTKHRPAKIIYNGVGTDSYMTIVMPMQLNNG